MEPIRPILLAFGIIIIIRTAGKRWDRVVIGPIRAITRFSQRGQNVRRHNEIAAVNFVKRKSPSSLDGV